MRQNNLKTPQRYRAALTFFAAIRLRNGCVLALLLSSTATWKWQTHPAAFLGRFSPLLEAEYISDVADAGLRTLAT